jgi:hypothetical protein
MLNNMKHVFAICLLAFASMQSAQATMVYSSAGAVPGTSAAPATLSVFDTFEVEGGMEYLATLSDIGTVFLPVIDNFDSLSMVILDDSFTVVGTPLLLAPVSGTGEVAISFSFTAISDAIYSIALGGATDSISTYVATVAAVPVPASIWFMGSAVFALVGFNRRKTV